MALNRPVAAQLGLQIVDITWSTAHENLRRLHQLIDSTTNNRWSLEQIQDVFDKLFLHRLEPVARLANVPFYITAGDMLFKLDMVNRLLINLHGMCNTTGSSLIFQLTYFFNIEVRTAYKKAQARANELKPDNYAANSIGLFAQTPVQNTASPVVQTQSAPDNSIADEIAKVRQALRPQI